MSKTSSKSAYWKKSPVLREQLALFPTSMENALPPDHPVRLLDEVLDSLDWSDWEKEYNGRAVQPPIHPSLLCKVLLYAMIRRIRSSRQIEYALKFHVDFLWLASGMQVDHTTLSKFRKRHGKQVKEIFKQTVRKAVEMGVAKLSSLCIDGTRVLANASRSNTLTTKKVDQLVAEVERQMAEAMADLDCGDTHDDLLEDLLDDGGSEDRLPESIADMQARKEQLEAIGEQLASMEEQRRRDGVKTPAQLPAADTDARVLPNKEGGYAPNYTPMVVTETTSGVIVASDVLIGNIEHTAMFPMIDTIEEDFGQTPETMMGDGAYCTGRNIDEAEQREIELLSNPPREDPADNPARRDDPTQPVAEEDLDRLPINRQTKRFDKRAFVYVEAEDRYYCPAGRPLHRDGTEQGRRAGETIVLTKYICRECDGCSIFDRCRPKPNAKCGRRITRDGYEPHNSRQSERMRKDDAKDRYKQRFHYGETQFAVIKTLFDFRRFLLRGREGVGTEWTWVSTAFNVMKLMRALAALRAAGRTIAANVAS